MIDKQPRQPKQPRRPKPRLSKIPNRRTPLRRLHQALDQLQAKRAAYNPWASMSDEEHQTLKEICQIQDQISQIQDNKACAARPPSPAERARLERMKHARALRRQIERRKAEEEEAAEERRRVLRRAFTARVKASEDAERVKARAASIAASARIRSEALTQSILKITKEKGEGPPLPQPYLHSSEMTKEDLLEEKARSLRDPRKSTPEDKAFRPYAWSCSPSRALEPETPSCDNYVGSHLEITGLPYLVEGGTRMLPSSRDWWKHSEWYE